MSRASPLPSSGDFSNAVMVGIIILFWRNRITYCLDPLLKLALLNFRSHLDSRVTPFEIMQGAVARRGFYQYVREEPTRILNAGTAPGFLLSRSSIVDVHN